MKKILKWLGENWKVWVYALVGILTLGAVVIGAKKIAEVVEGIRKKRKFYRVIGNPDGIAVDDGKGGLVEATLPDGVEFDQVEAAGVTEAGKIQVEVKHETTDRAHYGSAIDGNALDSLGFGKGSGG